MLSRRIGVCFDIDGVLLRGKQVLPGAIESLRKLGQNNIPFVFMTNGGGHMEEYRANILSDHFGMNISKDQIVLSHTPMRSLVDMYRENRVMIMGCRDEINVAKQYGFKKVVSPQQFCAQHAELFPFRQVKLDPIRDEYVSDPIAAILIMHDPIDWHLETQVCIDLLLGRDPISKQIHKFEISQTIPVYNSNEDFIFSSAYDHPRFAQGAFLETLQHLFKLSSGGLDLKVERFGKPHKVSFDHARNLLKNQLNSKGNPPEDFETIFMIGDNMDADIKGVKNSGNPWKGILVESGIYRGGTHNGMADHICPDVTHAIDLILSHKK